MIDEKILSVLRTHQDSYVPGEELCKHADISRTAIWKRIEKLREEGYEIEALPHLGYRLVSIPNVLIPTEIRWKLYTKIIGREVISYKEVESTNDVAYALAEKGMKEGAAIFAEHQSCGKGRQGRHWVSPSGAGVYLSCILRPDIAPNAISTITLIAAVSVAKAIREETGLAALIKWPNDILVNGKKVCGILTEMKAEQDRVDFIVLGIGVNVNTSRRHLPAGATSLREEMDEGAPVLSRVSIARAILAKLDEDYRILKQDGFGPIIEEWKHLSAMIGARVRVTLAHKTLEGCAHDLDSDGALMLRLDSGVIERVSSGDVMMLR